MNKYFKLFFKMTLGLTLLLLVGVYAIEYFYEVPPCKLCYKQRIPHWIILFISLLGIYKLRFKEILAYTIVLLYLVSAGLSFHHLSVENHWFGLTSDCTTYIDSKITEIEKFRAQIMNNEITSCEENHFKIFQVSLAGWNFIFSLAAFLFSLIYVIIFTMVNYDPHTEKITWRFRNKRIN